MSNLYNALSGGQVSPVQQPSAPLPAGSPAVGGGSLHAALAPQSLDPADIAGAKYGWSPEEIQRVKEMRAHVPPSSHQPATQATPSPYMNLGKHQGEGAK